MDEVAVARQRAEGAGGLADLLAAAWDAFGVISSVCWACEKRADELFTAFMLAGVAADEARLVLASAPSLPAGPAGAEVGPVHVGGPVEVVADAVAELARVLSGRLVAVAAGAADPGDQEACRDAAGGADRAVQLLSRDGR